MKLNKIFLSMAALAFVGAMTAGCSGDDLTAETPQLPDTAGGTVLTKVTVSLDEHASTRMLNPSGMKTFEEGDKIAVIYKNMAGETVKAESAALNSFDILSSNSAKFSVTLTNPQANTPVRYIYPASMAADDVSATTPDNDATIKWSNLASQSGGFSFISEHVDLAVFDGTMTAQAVLPAATLENPLTIGAFTITNSATNDEITDNVKKLIVNDGTNTYTLEGGWSTVIFVAMKPISKTQTVTIKAITADNKFIKSVTNKELAKNTKYDINVSLTARYPLAVTAASVSSDDIGSVIGANGKIYLNATAAAAASPATTAVAMITYVGSATGETSFTHGLALALSDSDANDGYFYWKTEQLDAGHIWQTDRNNFTSESGLQYNSFTPGHNTDTYPAFKAAMANNGTTKPTNCSDWFLPTAYQWNQMIDACKNVLGTKNSYKDLRDGFNSVGGTNMKLGEYWSSTEDGTNTAWSYRFHLGYWASEPKTFYCIVRSALAF